jgi:hypothetical protein
MPESDLSKRLYSAAAALLRARAEVALLVPETDLLTRHPEATRAVLVLGLEVFAGLEQLAAALAGQQNPDGRPK